MKVNLGAGRQAYEHSGYVSVDIIPSDGIDYIWDCENGLPKRLDGSGNLIKVFPDNTVDEFLCRHFLEHIRNLISFIDELWDALKPNGILHIFVPNAECPRAAWGDPTHVRAFSVISFSYFTKEALVAYPYTDKPWRIDEGYPRINGTPPDDLWEIEIIMRPDK